MPDMITTAEELEALPVGSVILWCGRVWQRMDDTQPYLHAWMCPDGEFYTAICLIMDDGQMAKLRPLLMESIAMARRAAAGGDH